MLIQILIDLEDIIVSSILGLIPSVTLASIPFIGNTVQSSLISFVTYLNAFIDIFPYAEIVWQLFIYGVIPFEIGLITLKFFLGNRTPARGIDMG